MIFIIRKGVSPWLDHGSTLCIYSAPAINDSVNDMKESMKLLMKIAS